MFQAVAIGVAQADVVLTPPGNNRRYANVRWENYENYTYEISCGAKIVQKLHITVFMLLTLQFLQVSYDCL